jgi:hypothetical protein
MAKIEGICRDVGEATEFVTIVTTDDDGPHVVGNWGDYMRILGIKEDTIIFPAGRYLQTEQNLRKNNRIQLLVASRKVQGTRSPGQGCPHCRHRRQGQSGRRLRQLDQAYVKSAMKPKSMWTC